MSRREGADDGGTSPGSSSSSPDLAAAAPGISGSSPRAAAGAAAPAGEPLPLPLLQLERHNSSPAVMPSFVSCTSFSAPGTPQAQVGRRAGVLGGLCQPPAGCRIVQRGCMGAA